MRSLHVPSSAIRVLVCFASLGIATFLRAQTPAAGVAPPIDSKSIYRACAGQWAGTLEYRDFQSDERVSLPTNLESVLAADGNSLELAYTYDDGPGKIVRESSTLVINPEKRTLTITSDRTKSSEQLTISNIDEVARTRRLTLILTAAGEENHNKVDVRSTLSCSPNTLSWLRETRVPGHDFAFRDKYSFSRWPIQAH